MNPADLIARLNSLADQAEKATGPDRELDVDICIAVGAYSQEAYEVFGTHYPLGYFIVHAARALVYTSSLDAAMTLVPEWAKLHFLQETEYDNPEPEAWSANLRARSWKEHESGFGTEWQSWAATPALAFTAASLRALAAQESSQ